MVYNRFFLKVTTRVVIIFALLVGLASIFLRTDLIFTQLILVTILVVLLVELVRFVNQTNYDLSRFLASVKDGDFSVSFSKDNQTASFRALHHSFKDLIDTFKDLETEKFAQLQFLNQLVDQIEFGILTFNHDQQIEVINQHALNLLDLPKIRSWKKIKNPNTKFLHHLLELGESRNQLVETTISGETHLFSVNITRILILEHPYLIVSFQDIKAEIQQKEIEAWHKLIRILTHEIMNSITPLVSLTETAEMLLTDENGTVRTPEAIDQEHLEDVMEAIRTIRDRSQGILSFVQDYRKLTRIPKPRLENLPSGELMQGVFTLLEADLKRTNISFELGHIEPCMLRIDQHLIEQVLINLVKNAKEALNGCADPTIRMDLHRRDEEIRIAIHDNGPGVPAEKQDRIFIPFYTTKKEGSGIGLSVSRQIVNLHGGIIDLASQPGATTFTLILPGKRD